MLILRAQNHATSRHVHFFSAQNTATVAATAASNDGALVAPVENAMISPDNDVGSMPSRNYLRQLTGKEHVK